MIVFRSDLAKEFHRPIDGNAPLKAGVEKMAADTRAAKPEEHAVLEAYRQNQALEKERENAQGARPDAMTTQGIGALGRSATDEASEARFTPLGEQAASHESENTVETAKLLKRASRLLRLGDIGAARMVLALAHDNGSARAVFMLAETYDPLVLSTWKAAGTGADPTKARELYARAYAGGIAEAKKRSNALPN
jgi:hypothetical protein